MQRRSPAAAEASGSTLINLVIRDEDAGLGGRILLTFGKRNQTLALPWTRLGSGTPVILSEEGSQDNADGWRGVVSRLSKDSLQVAFSQWPETESERATFRLDRSSDEISRQRQRQGLEKASAAADFRFAELRDVLLGLRPPAFHPVEFARAVQPNPERLPTGSGALCPDCRGCRHHPRPARYRQDHHADRIDPPDHAPGSARTGGGPQQHRRRQPVRKTSGGR